MLVSEDPQDVYGLVDLPVRAWGSVSADSPPEELLAALQAVHAGLATASPALLGAALRRLAPAGDGSGLELPLEALTDRESEVLQWLAQGLPNKGIAAALGISEHTVKFHISSIYAKLGASNRTEAVRLGVQWGLVVL